MLGRQLANGVQRVAAARTTILEQLLSHCPSAYFKPEEAWPMIERWRVDKPRVAGEKRYYPGPAFHVRSRLADLLQADDLLLKSDDLALRLYYFRRFSPYQYISWDDDIRREFASGETDPIYAAMENRELWMTKELREKLQKLAWAAPDEHHDMMVPNVFKGKLRDYRDKYPRLFKDEDESSEVPLQPLLSISDQAKEPQPAWVDGIVLKIASLQSELVILSESVTRMTEREALSTPEPETKNKISDSIPWWLWLTIGVFVGTMLLRH